MTTPPISGPPLPSDLGRLLRLILGNARDRHSPREPQPTLGDWWRLFREAAPRWPESIDRAVVGGLLADRVAYALAAGYRSALDRLFPTVPEGEIVSLCVTEEGGGHPRAIHATLRPAPEAGPTPGGPSLWLLSGRKQWATLAGEARWLVVAASTGIDPAGRNQLRLALVERGAPGVSIHPMVGVPFAPEVSHAVVELDEVRVPADRILPGDGYERYIKPFRTIEDIHVAGALLGHLVGIALASGWPRPVLEEASSLLASLRAIASLDPTAPETHIALAGFLAAERRFVEAIRPHFAGVDPEARDRWERDSPLLEVAGKARAKRLDAAWRALAGASPDIERVP